MAGLLFVILCFAASRQSQILDVAGWTRSGWEEPVQIGTPADVLLFAFYLPALVGLLPLLPLTYWIESGTRPSDCLGPRRSRAVVSDWLLF